VEWAARLDLELCNLRGALATSLSDPDPDPGLRLGASLGEFWFLRGYGVEGADTLRAHLDRASGEAPRLLRGRALAAAGRLVEEYVADYPLALMMAEEALAIAHDEGDDVLAMRAILVVVIARNLQGDHRGSLLLNARGWALDELGLDGRASYEECAELNRRAGDQRGLAAGVGNLGFLALLAGDLDAAREHNGEALRVFRELGDLRGVAIGSLNSGYATYLDGDGVAACRLFLECLATARRMGARRYVAYAILGLADTATLTGHSQRAATLHGAFDALFEQLGAGIEALEARLREADHARLRALLGDSAFDIAYSAGRALPLDHVLALAISPAD
jgi:tetratricopeptide (TPR) repeat protein